MADRTLGLTLGKFAPLHRGHQYVIETALGEVDDLIIMIYDCPETTPIPLPVRARWIRDIYPQVEVVEAWDGPTQVGDSPEIMKLNEDFILQKVQGRPVTHFYSSEFYGDHVSKALGARNRLVDPSRSRYALSGSLVRQDPYAYRHLIHSRVYRDLVINIVFVGAPSSGKTTITERMAREYRTVWMPEYGREYWERNQVNRRLSVAQLVEIAERHIAREEELICQANTYLFTDTNATTTFLFSQYYHGRSADRLTALADDAARRYDIVFLCDIDIPYDASWDRSGEANRRVFQKQVVADMQQRRIPYFLLSGTVEDRVKIAKRILAQYEKYMNLACFARSCELPS